MDNTQNNLADSDTDDGPLEVAGAQNPQNDFFKAPQDEETGAATFDGPTQEQPESAEPGNNLGAAPVGSMKPENMIDNKDYHVDVEFNDDSSESDGPIGITDQGGVPPPKEDQPENPQSKVQSSSPSPNYNDIEANIKPT